MKKIVFIMIMVLAFTTGGWSQNRKITEMGRYPFARLGATVTAGEMGVQLSQRYDQDLIAGFSQAGYPELATPFLVELNSGRYGDRELAVGTVFNWMLFRSKGKVALVKNLEWAGNAPLPVYSYTVRHGDYDYAFVVPKPCGNVALVGITEVVKPATVPSVTPEPAMKSQPAMKGDEAVVQANNNLKEPQPVPEATDIAKRLFLLIEGGPGVVRGTFTMMFWARVGILYQLVPDSLDLIFSVGGASSFREEPWKPFLMTNALLSLHLQPFYLAGGLGFSMKERVDRRDGFDLVGELGINLFEIESSVSSLFFELRVPIITADRLFEEHYKILLGWRFLF